MSVCNFKVFSMVEDIELIKGTVRLPMGYHLRGNAWAVLHFASISAQI
jgi:hypothetical protein